MKRRLAFFSLALAVMLVLSGCFSLRTFYWSRKTAPAGGSSNAVLNMRPYSATSLSGIPVVLVGLDDMTVGNLRVWDDDGNFGGPYTMVKDNALASLMVTGTECSASGLSASSITGMTWTAYRNPVEITTGANNTDANAQAKFRINNSETGNTVNSAMFFTGTWIDDGDGNPESGEIVCTGAILTTLPIAGP